MLDCEVSVSCRPILQPKFRIGDRVAYVSNGCLGEILDVWWHFGASAAAYVVTWDDGDDIDELFEEEYLCLA